MLTCLTTPLSNKELKCFMKGQIFADTFEQGWLNKVIYLDG